MCLFFCVCVLWACKKREKERNCLKLRNVNTKQTSKQTNKTTPYDKTGDDEIQDPNTLDTLRSTKNNTPRNQNQGPQALQFLRELDLLYDDANLLRIADAFEIALSSENNVEINSEMNNNNNNLSKNNKNSQNIKENTNTSHTPNKHRKKSLFFVE